MVRLAVGDGAGPPVPGTPHRTLQPIVAGVYVSVHVLAPQLYIQPSPHGVLRLGVTLFGQNGAVIGVAPTGVGTGAMPQLTPHC
jgi:hypothetical protein